MCHKWQG